MGPNTPNSKRISSVVNVSVEGNPGLSQGEGTPALGAGYSAGGVNHSAPVPPCGKKGEQSWITSTSDGSGVAAGIIAATPSNPPATSNGEANVAKLTADRLAEASLKLAEAQAQNPSAYLDWDLKAGEIKVYQTFTSYQAGEEPRATVKLR